MFLTIVAATFLVAAAVVLAVSIATRVRHRTGEPRPRWSWSSIPAPRRRLIAAGSAMLALTTPLAVFAAFTPIQRALAWGSIIAIAVAVAVISLDIDH